jgi:hypothetical protein
MAGRTTLGGSLEDLETVTRVDPPYAVRATVTVNDILNAPRFEFRAEAGPAALNVFKSEWPAATVRLEASGGGEPSRLWAGVNAKVGYPGMGDFLIDLKGGIASKALVVDRIEISMPDLPARLQASGRVELDDRRRFDFRADWRDLQWPLQQPQVHSAEGRLSVSGTVADYTLQLQAAIGGMPPR